MNDHLDIQNPPDKNYPLLSKKQIETLNVLMVEHPWLKTLVQTYKRIEDQSNHLVEQDEKRHEPINREHSILGECFGIEFVPRDPLDPHILLRLLEANGKWFGTRGVISSAWLPDMINVLQRVEIVLDLKYQKDVLEDRQDGYRFPRKESSTTKESSIAYDKENYGKGTTTLDYLFHNYPWLKKMIQDYEEEIKTLKSGAIKPEQTKAKVPPEILSEMMHSANQFTQLIDPRSPENSSATIDSLLDHIIMLVSTLRWIEKDTEHACFVAFSPSARGGAMNCGAIGCALESPDEPVRSLIIEALVKRKQK